jgi:formylglycine-generating enzyme required for sulfatase activity
MKNSMKLSLHFMVIYRDFLVNILLFVILSSCAMNDSALKEEVAQLRKDLRDVRVELNKIDPTRFAEPEPEKKVNVTPLTGKIYKNSIGMEFIEIPAGEFLMGCSNSDTECDENRERPQHYVMITNSFYIGKYEVTQGEWKKVMGNNPSDFVNCGEDCPVENISWNNAQKFIGELCKREEQSPCKYRLPTEAEWEYSARAGGSAGSKYFWGDSINDEYLWYDENSGKTTHPVGKKKPNAWGLYDMTGNVWEWVGDWFGPYRIYPSNDPKGIYIGESRVFRGGSWYNNAKNTRVSYRGIHAPDYGDHGNGFRLVLIR